MVNRNKVLITIFAILMTMCLGLKYSYSEEKLSGKVIKDIILLLAKHDKLLPMYTKKVLYDQFIITNSFFSLKNGRYCIEVNSVISYEGRESTLAEFKHGYVKLINKRYSFSKKYNQWYGYDGWGPGED
jgi:hypothetical protein